MSQFSQFSANIPDQAVEVSDKSNIYQCMDLAYLWVFCLGFPKATIQKLYAYQTFTQANDLTRQYFDVIPNSDTFIPKEGDLGVFGTGVGVAGHICVCTGVGNLKTFQSIDQNWAGVQRAVKVTHTYTNFLGVLRPKAVAGAACLIGNNDEGSALFAKLVHNSSIADDTVKYLGLAEKADAVSFETIKNSLEARDGKLTSCKTELATRDSDLAKANQEVQNRIEQIGRVQEQLTESIKAQKDAQDKLKSTQIEHETEVTKLTAKIEQVQSSLNEEAKAKGRALNDLAECQAKLETALKGQYPDLTFKRWLALLATVKWS